MSNPARKMQLQPGSQIHKRARAKVKGLILHWVDVDPLAETTERITAKAKHRNPILNIVAHKIYRDYGQFIMTQQAFRWFVQVHVIFDYPNGRRQREMRELNAHTTIQNLNHYCMDHIENAFLWGNMDHYTHTEFTIECLGDH